MSVRKAIEIFIRGFCFGKSQSYPYTPKLINELWVLRDDPPRKKERKTEVIAYDLPPTEVTRRIREQNLPWHFVCHLHESDSNFEQIRAEYKDHGYRALATEWMFVHDMADIPSYECDLRVTRVSNLDQANLVKIAAGRRQISGRALCENPPKHRLYAAMDDEKALGWVSSIAVGRSAWVANLYVKEEMRGQGIGRALMSAMLLDDLKHGVRQSVLLASSAGARLYPHLGYRKIGTLQLFCPANRSGSTSNR